MNELQAGPVNGGYVEDSGPETPSDINLLNTGKYPASDHGLIRSKVAPSKPITKTLFITSISNKNKS